MAALTDEIRRLVRDQRLGVVATVSPDNTPCISPKGSLALLRDDNLVFADIHSPQTLINLAANPSIEVVVVDHLSRLAARFSGKGTILPVGPDFWQALGAYRDEGSDISRIRSLVVIQVEHAEMIRSPIYDTGLTEDEIRALWREYFTKLEDRTILDLNPPRDF
jgi:uncharacterized protein